MAVSLGSWRSVRGAVCGAGVDAGVDAVVDAWALGDAERRDEVTAGPLVTALAGCDVEGTGVQHASTGVAQQLAPDGHLEPAPTVEPRPAQLHLVLQPVPVQLEPDASHRPLLLVDRGQPRRQPAAHPVAGVLVLADNRDEDAGMVNCRNLDSLGEPDLQPRGDPLGELGPRDPFPPAAVDPVLP